MSDFSGFDAYFLFVDKLGKAGLERALAKGRNCTLFALSSKPVLRGEEAPKEAGGHGLALCPLRPIIAGHGDRQLTTAGTDN